MACATHILTFWVPNERGRTSGPSVGRRSWQCDPDLSIKVRYEASFDEPTNSVLYKSRAPSKGIARLPRFSRKGLSPVIWANISLFRRPAAFGANPGDVALQVVPARRTATGARFGRDAKYPNRRRQRQDKGYPQGKIACVFELRTKSRIPGSPGWIPTMRTSAQNI